MRESVAEGERERDFIGLTHAIAEAGRSKICRVGQQAGNPVRR